MVTSTMAAAATSVDMVMTGHSLGRNKLEHLLAAGMAFVHTSIVHEAMSSLSSSASVTDMSLTGLSAQLCFSFDLRLSHQPSLRWCLSFHMVT